MLPTELEMHNSLAEDVSRLQCERDAAIKELYRWRSAFQECTPGGSEFMSPESVIAYMRTLKRETVEAKLELARLRKAQTP